MQEIIYAELHTYICVSCFHLIEVKVYSKSVSPHWSLYCKSGWKTCYVVEGNLRDTQSFWKFLDGIWSLWMISQKKNPNVFLFLPFFFLEVIIQNPLKSLFLVLFRSSLHLVQRALHQNQRKTATFFAVQR